MKKTQLALVAAICTVAGCQVANATLVVDSLVGGAPIGSYKVNFNNLPLGDNGGNSEIATGPSGSLTVQFITDGKTVTGAESGKYAAPYLSSQNGIGFADGGGNQSPIPGADTTQYLTTGSGAGRAILTFPVAQTYMGLLWGSVDNYNNLEFFNGNTPVGIVNGTQVWAAANGDQGQNGTFYVNITSDRPFTSVVASSATQYAFEFDNVAFNAVPEPTTVLAGALLLLPFGASTIRGLRRKA